MSQDNAAIAQALRMALAIIEANNGPKTSPAVEPTAPAPAKRVRRTNAQIAAGVSLASVKATAPTAVQSAVSVQPMMTAQPVKVNAFDFAEYTRRTATKASEWAAKNGHPFAQLFMVPSKKHAGWHKVRFCGPSTPLWKDATHLATCYANGAVAKTPAWSANVREA